MRHWRRSLYNLRRTIGLAMLATVGLTFAGVVFIYFIRSADDAGDFVARSATAVATLFALSAGCALVGRPLPSRIALELDLTSLPPESVGDTPVATLAGARTLTLRQVVETLDRAAADRRVGSVIAYIGFDAGGLATIQELRGAIQRLRSAGKRTIAFADSFGQIGGGNGAYYLASAFDEIYLQPSGEVGLVGLHRDVNFVKRALDKAGVDVIAEGRHEYKNAANQLTETGFTQPHREALERLMESQWQQIVEGVATSRGMSAQQVQDAADRGPLFAEDALEAGLIDVVGFRDEAVDAAKAAAGPRSELRWLPRYRRFAVRTSRAPGRPTVAVITAVGAIGRTKVPFNPLSPSSSIAGDRVASIIRRAVADRKVKAIVLRVSSPGGSAVGSETMWREVVRAKEAGTPVVASMGDVAASGGYYMSMAAARIVAQPGTVTGSIGVVAQKPVVARAKDRIGIDVESLSTGAHAGLLSFNRSFDDSEHAVFSEWLDHIYDDFTEKVAAGRSMTRAAVHEVARGRVWSGSDALDRGLIDDLGGFDAALRHAREVAGIPAGAPLRVVDYPKASKLTALRASAGRNSEDPKGVLSSVRAALDPLRPVLLALGAGPHRDALHCGLEESDWLVR